MAFVSSFPSVGTCSHTRAVCSMSMKHGSFGNQAISRRQFQQLLAGFAAAWVIPQVASAELANSIIAKRELVEHYDSALDAMNNLDDLRSMVDLSLVDSLRTALRGPVFGNVRIDCNYLVRHGLGPNQDQKKVTDSYKQLMDSFQKLDSYALNYSRGKNDDATAGMRTELDNIQKKFELFIAMIPNPKA